MKSILATVILLSAVSLAAQAPTPAGKAGQPATDVTGAEVKTFIDKLPKNAISDLPIRVVDVGGYRVGVFGVFRPKSVKQDAVLHEAATTEVYYMLEGSGTLVTGGTLIVHGVRQPRTHTVCRSTHHDRWRLH